jgi:hypothetical protein
MVGRTTWKFRRVVAVDVVFPGGIPCRIGMGPHEHGTNDGYAWYYGVQEARILIDAKKAVPLCIISYPCPPYTKYDPRTATTWDFSPDFFEVDGGLAPRWLKWHSHDVCRGYFWDLLRFQVVDGIWIFKNGVFQSGHLISRNPDFGFRERFTETALTVRFQLADFRLEGKGTKLLPGNTNQAK